MFKIQNPVNVQDDLYTEEVIQSYPAIAWHGKYDGVNKSGGFFTLDVDAVEGKPAGWEETEIRYGTDPNAALVPVYKTQQLRCVPIGIRKRIIITDTLRNDHMYAWRTPKNQRVSGRFTSHYQVMLMIPGLNEPCVLGLRGQTKTTAWDNEATGRYSNKAFPTGVSQLLTAFAHEASKVNNQTLPRFCLWEIVLQPYIVDGQAQYVTMGSGDSVAYMNSFTAKMSAQNPEFLEATFVGNAEFEVFQALRQDVTVEWEAQWSREKMQAEASNLNALFAPGKATSPVVEPTFEDPIPF